METQKPEQVLPLGQIIQGDNVEVLKTFPDNCIDLTVTSPPYDELDEDWKRLSGARVYKGFDWNFPELAKELYRVTKPGGVLVWVVGDTVVDGSETGVSFRQALHFKEIGFRLHDTMIYEKANYMMSSEQNRFTQIFEYMFVLSKGAPKAANMIKDRPTRTRGHVYRSRRRDLNGDEIFYTGFKKVGAQGKRTNIWAYDVGNGLVSDDMIVHEHPAPFPDLLAEDCVKSWSNPGDVVLDPFAGSGTTLKMSEKLGRKWVGIEIAGEYIKIAEKRLEPYRNQTRL